MKKIVPDYYKKFRCIADKCRHSCCIGWEIDIDDETFEKYTSIDGDFGKRLRENIRTENDSNCFILGENERCPFLNCSGLCDIYIELGEENLSQICTDHPRFRNFFSDREELGLGLCCEEVCRIVLSHREKAVLEILEDDGEDFGLYEGEAVILTLREKLFDLAQNEEFNMEHRCEKILDLFDLKLSAEFISRALNEMSFFEILDTEWREIIEETKEMPVSLHFDEHFQTEFEQLLVYFIYRHVAEAEDLSDFAARSCFCVMSSNIISHIFEALKKDSSLSPFELLCNVCRMYSSEIEYCEENTEKLIELVKTEYAINDAS